MATDNLIQIHSFFLLYNSMKQFLLFYKQVTFQVSYLLYFYACKVFCKKEFTNYTEMKVCVLNISFHTS